MITRWFGTRARVQARVERERERPRGGSMTPTSGSICSRPAAAVLWATALAGATLMALGPVVGPALGPMLVVGLLAAAAGLVGWRLRAARVEERRRRSQLPEALERLAAALRSGASLPQALAAAGTATPAPLGHELRSLAGEAERGRALADVLDRWVATHDDRGTRLAATALALAATVGAAPARAVDGVAATLRERHQLAAERRALATQARTSAAVLAVAPVGFALLLGLGDGAAARFLLRTPRGWACLATGLALDVAGGVWMARLVGSEDP